ncbi:MAG: hypothetical protein HY842_16805 [Bacteroidetes bacterium]|nr:hypothetical protein [Bacteroidota bacterium]
MNVSIEKLDLIQQILLIKDEKLLKSIASLIQTKRKSSEETEGWEELPASVRAAIEESQRQMETGESILLDDVLEKYRKR